MLKWPERANAAIRKLFEPLQEFDVYVEDTNDEPFYRCLLNYIASEDVTIARVFGLGGRQAVLDFATSYNQKSRRALFIIDGDLAWVKGESLARVPGVHRHEAYCIENLLICERAISTILAQEIVVTESDATKLLNFQQWRSAIIAPLAELFAAFATVNDFDPTVATVSQRVGNVCETRQTVSLDPAKVRVCRDRALKAAEAKANVQVVTTRYNTLVSRIMTMHDPSRAISGKDYLLPLLGFHLQSFHCRIKTKSLRMRLASAGDKGRFSELADALLSTARGQL